MLFNLSGWRYWFHAYFWLGYFRRMARVVKKVRAGLSLRQFGGALSVPSVGAKNDSIFRRPVKASGWAFVSSMNAKSYYFFAGIIQRISKKCAIFLLWSSSSTVTIFQFHAS
jgi:hypothetical protein